LDDEVVFCPNCGTRIAQEVKEEAKPAEETKPAEAPAKEPAKDTKAEEPKKEEKPVEEKKAEEPKKEEPKAEEPKKEEKPVEEKKAEKPKKEKPAKAKKPKKAKPSFIVAFFSFLLCIIIFLATIGAGAIGSVRMSYSQSKVESIVESIDLADDTLPSLDLKKELGVVEFLSDAAGFDFEKSAGISNKDLEKFLSKSYVKEEVAEIAGGVVGYFMEGKEPEPISAKTFLDFIEKHNDDLLELTGFSFIYTHPETGQKVVYDVDVKNAFKDLGTDEVTMSYIEKELGTDFGMVQFGLSIWGIVTFAAVALLVSILVLLINGKTIRSGFSFVGMTLLLAGLVMDAAAGIVMLMHEKWIPGTIPCKFIDPLLTSVLIIGSAILVFGLLLFVIARAICSAAAKKKLAAAEN